MPEVINSFRGKYEFLSNFYPAQVEYQRVIYPSVEHAYQAAKTKNQARRIQIRDTLLAADAKKLGNKKDIPIRADWEEIKVKIMLKLVRRKFQHPAFKKKLLATGDAELIEGNWWKDYFWGVCNGVGENKLGKILMKVRADLIDA